MNKEYQFKISDYKGKESTWPNLERDSQAGCQCGNCPDNGKPFTEQNPMEMGCRCHPGSPMVVTYWDGWLYLRCAFCDQAVTKIPVSRSLL